MGYSNPKRNFKSMEIHLKTHQQSTTFSFKMKPLTWDENEPRNKPLQIDWNYFMQNQQPFF